MVARSAGLLVFRTNATDGGLEVLLVHPGGPLWERRDVGAWSVPKGEVGVDEDLAVAAQREFVEELGIEPPNGGWLDLGEIRQAGGKRVRAWAVAGDLEVDAVVSNLFEMEWPPRSGHRVSFSEVDRAGWFSLPVARRKLVPGQVPLLDRLEAALGHDVPE